MGLTVASLTFNIAADLFPNIWTMITQLISTGILFLVVKHFLWQPAREFLDKRAEYAQDQIAQAEGLRHEAAKMNADADSTLKNAGAQAREIIDKAKHDSLVLKDSILKDAKQEADIKLEAARKEIEYEKQAMRNEVTKEIVDVALAATEKLLLDKVTDDDDRLAIEKFVKEVSAK